MADEKRKRTRLPGLDDAIAALRPGQAIAGLQAGQEGRPKTEKPEQLPICEKCGALVGDHDKHLKWHSSNVGLGRYASGDW
jgi:hypothetical protein